MKTKIKKIVLPMVVALVAIAGAFASNLSNQSTTATALNDRQGYVRQGTVCTPTAVVCSTIFHPMLCTDGANILYDWNGTACPTPLRYKP
jgi:hypothetical protein